MTRTPKACEAETEQLRQLRQLMRDPPSIPYHFDPTRPPTTEVIAVTLVTCKSASVLAELKADTDEGARKLIGDNWMDAVERVRIEELAAELQDLADRVHRGLTDLTPDAEGPLAPTASRRYRLAVHAILTPPPAPITESLLSGDRVLEGAIALARGHRWRFERFRGELAKTLRQHDIPEDRTQRVFDLFDGAAEYSKYVTPAIRDGRKSDQFPVLKEVEGIGTRGPLPDLYRRTVVQGLAKLYEASNGKGSAIVNHNHPSAGGRHSRAS